MPLFPLRPEIHDMNTVTRLLLGIVAGVLLTLLTLVLALAGARVLIGLAMINGIVALATLLSGALLGAVGVGLGYLTAGRERSVLVLLIGLAIAALAVMLGGYGNGSVLPLGIYGLAVVNSLLIARVTAVLDHEERGTRESNLRG